MGKISYIFYFLTCVFFVLQSEVLVLCKKGKKLKKYIKYYNTVIILLIYIIANYNMQQPFFYRAENGWL